MRQEEQAYDFINSNARSGIAAISHNVASGYSTIVGIDVHARTDETMRRAAKDLREHGTPSMSCNISEGGYGGRCPEGSYLVQVHGRDASVAEVEKALRAGGSLTALDRFTKIKQNRSAFMPSADSAAHMR